MNRRVRFPSPTTLRWYVAAFGGFQGAVLLLAPHWVDPAIYGGLRDLSLPWGALFFLGALLLTTTAAARLPRRWVLLAHIPIAFAFLLQATLFVTAGVWTGLFTIGTLGLGVAVAAFLPPRERGEGESRADLLSATLGVSGSVNGFLLMVPGLNTHAIFDFARPALLALGFFWLASSLALLALHVPLPEGRGAAIRERVLRYEGPIHLVAGLLFILVGLLVAWPSRAWIGVVYYCGAGLLLLFLPGLRRALRDFDPVSVRTRLALALAMAAGLTLVFTVALVTREQERQVRTQLVDTLDRQAQAVALNVSDFLNLKGVRARKVAELVTTEPFDSVGQQIVMENCRDEDPDFTACAVLDLRGNILARAGNPTATRRMFADAYATYQPEDSVWVDLLLGQTVDRTLPLLATAVSGRDGFMIGTLLVALDEEALTRRIGRSGSSVHLSDGRGRSIARELPMGDEQVGGFQQMGDGEILGSVQVVPDLGWQVEAGQPVSTALRELYEQREMTFWLLLLMSGLVSLAGAMAAASVAHPLDRLIAALEQMEAGNLEAPVQRGGMSELDRLAVAFDHMRNRLAQQTRAREDLARALEERAEVLSEQDRRKDEFLAMLAHELRNPLGAIGNTVFLLREGEVSPTEQTRLLQVIERQSVHLARMVDDLLDVSRITRGKVNLRKERVDLIPLAHQVARDFEPRAEAAGLTLTAEIPEVALWADADPTRVGQVLGNLLTNAVKYTDRGGSIVFRVSEEAGDAVFSVRDTGRGLDPELLPRVFELFIQGDQGLDRADSGLGIGLTLVQRLVEMHDGSVVAFSKGLGQGSEFVVRLPLEAAPDELPAAPDHRTEGIRRVMLVDDHVDSVTALAAILEHGGHETHVCHDGEQALEEVRVFSPEAMVVDIGLPGMDGYEVARRLRESGGEGLLLIAVTGYGRKEDQERAFEAGFDHHLTKPVQPDELQRLLVDGTAGAPLLD